MPKRVLSTLFLFHHIATIFGMTAFRFRLTKPFHAESSTPRFIYSSVLSIFAVVIVIPTMKLQIIDGLRRGDKFINTFIFLLIACLSALAMVNLCFFQAKHRNDYVRLINKSVALNKLIAAQIPKRSEYFDPVCQRKYNRRMLVALLQTTVLVLPLTIMVNQLKSGRIFMFVFVLYTHLIRTIFGVAFYGSMLVVLQLYRDVNGRIERLIDDMIKVQVNVGSGFKKMQRYCELSDALDVMAQLYDQVTNLLNELVKFFGTLLLVELINSFLNVLYGVRNYN